MDYPFKICDPVHGFIRFNELEERVIDSRAFQRLRYIRQMGVAYLIYPGATHTRFEHSLGVMELVTRIFNTISHALPTEKVEYWRQILRLAALCHDMGHLPFSHTAERELLPDGGHEQMTLSLIRSPELRAIWGEMGEEAESDIIKLSVSDSQMPLTSMEQLLQQLITEDNFGADRIDYLIRDATYTGVGYGHFDYHQLIDSLQILPVSGTLKLGVSAAGIQSVESLWIARYMMYARVYRHPKSCVFTHHMIRFMERQYDSSIPYLEQNDATLLTSMIKAAKEGDEDAQVLLKQKPAYREIPYDPEVDYTAYGERVFVDRLPLSKGSREFPVLGDGGKVISSFEASPFLCEIPPGGKHTHVFVHPELRRSLANAHECVE